MELTPESLKRKAESLKRAPVEEQQSFRNMVFSLQQIGHISFRETKRIILILESNDYTPDNA